MMDDADVRHCFRPQLDQAARSALYSILRQIDESGIVYSIYGGAVLGSCCYQDILPWDDDVDLVIFQAIDLSYLQRVLPSLGITRSRNGNAKAFLRDRPTSTGFDWTLPFVDIATAELKEGFVLHNSVYGGIDRFQEDDFLPLRRTKLGPIEVLGPANPAAVCRSKYGEECLTSARAPFYCHITEQPTRFSQERVSIERINQLLGYGAPD